MKKLLMLYIAILLCLNCFSQSQWDSEADTFTKNAQQIIKEKNNWISNKKYNTALRLVRPEPKGFSMLYTFQIGSSEKTDIYKFDSRSMCVSLVKIEDVEFKNYYINDFLKSDFIRKSTSTFYHKTLNLMAIVEFDSKFVSITYSKKPKLK
ncbi:hypothetical protein [Pedobacter cryotolerans]|uniref:Uncharacterized protein n=1 Tax=Pedobacter cryotolerans TaxID=2571270 RepID=A0A4U1CDN9_9SPHI|nr:hypothetical protein [Pedobacter cryotolerans]TKC03417.1 hypothetical protein FA045_02270 [Pedobacter cryotolerans]